MEPLRLIYFDARGRIEPARLMLEHARVPYEFHGIAADTWQRPETKPYYRERSPLGQLPILEYGERRLCQSGAILRYLAERHGMYGATAEERARIDEVHETGVDLLFNLALFFWQPEPSFSAGRAAHRESFRVLLSSLQSYFARTRVTRERWIDPERITLADAAVAYALEVALPLHPGLLEEFPELHHFMTAFFATPAIAAYVRSSRRPRTFTVPFATFGGRPDQTHQWDEPALAPA